MNRLTDNSSVIPVLRVEEALIDLQKLACAIGRGEVERENVAWRLRHYLVVVELVLREFAHSPKQNEKSQHAVVLLQDVKRLVKELIEDLSDERLWDTGVEGNDADSSSRIKRAGGSLKNLGVRSPVTPLMARRWTP